MAAADEDAVGAVGKSFEDELRIQAARAHHADNARVGRVLHARGAGQVGCQIGTPVTEECDDPRFKGFRHEQALLQFPQTARRLEHPLLERAGWAGRHAGAATFAEHRVDLRSFIHRKGNGRVGHSGMQVLQPEQSSAIT